MLTVVFVLALVAVLVAASVLVITRRRLGRLGTAAGALGATRVRSGFFSEARYEGKSEGTPYTIRHRDASKHRPAVLTVSVEATHPATFRLARRDKWFDRIERFVGSGISTGDREFDGSYYLANGDASQLATLLRSADVRNAVRRLFGAGASAVEASRGALRAEWDPFTLGKDLTLGFVPDAVAAFAELRHAQGRAVPLGLARAASSAAVPGRLPGRWAKLAPFLAWVGIGAVAISSWDWPSLDTFALFLATLPFSVPLALLAAFLGFRSLIHRVRSARDIAGVMFAILGLVPVAGFGGAELANALLDAGVPQTRETLVVGKSIPKAKGGRKLYVESWRAQEAFEEIAVDRRTHRDAVPQESLLRVETGPGRLGFEWVVRAALAGQRATPVDPE